MWVKAMWLWIWLNLYIGYTDTFFPDQPFANPASVSRVPSSNLLRKMESLDRNSGGPTPSHIHKYVPVTIHPHHLLRHRRHVSLSVQSSLLHLCSWSHVLLSALLSPAPGANSSFYIFELSFTEIFPFAGNCSQSFPRGKKWGERRRRGGRRRTP